MVINLVKVLLSYVINIKKLMFSLVEIFVS